MSTASVRVNQWSFGESKDFTDPFYQAKCIVRCRGYQRPQISTWCVYRVKLDFLFIFWRNVHRYKMKKVDKRKSFYIFLLLSQPREKETLTKIIYVAITLPSHECLYFSVNNHIPYSRSMDANPTLNYLFQMKRWPSNIMILTTLLKQTWLSVFGLVHLSAPSFC